MKYRKKPVIVEAVQLRWTTWNEICEFLGDVVSDKNPGRLVNTFSDTCGEVGPPFIELTIPTKEGEHIARHGDWIIKGVIGEFYPCNPEVFEATYEMLEDEKYDPSSSKHLTVKVIDGETSEFVNLNLLKNVLSTETVERFARKHAAKAVWQSWRDNMLRQERYVAIRLMRWDELDGRDRALYTNIAHEVLLGFVHWALSEIFVRKEEE